MAGAKKDESFKSEKRADKLMAIFQGIHLKKSLNQSSSMVSLKKGFPEKAIKKASGTKLMISAKRKMPNEALRLERVEKKKGTIKPDNKLELIKGERKFGYCNLKDSLDKWNKVVEGNRTADHLKFPLESHEMEVYDHSKPTVPLIAVKSPLEIKLAEKGEGKPQPSLDTEHEDGELTIQEFLSKRRTFAKMRARSSYEAAKAKHSKKIKSKDHRQEMRREKRKKLEETLKKANSGEAGKMLESMDKSRALERMTLRHKNTGKWAKNLAVHAKHDKESRIALADQQKIGRELTEKHAVPVDHSVDSDDSLSSSDIGDDDANKMEAFMAEYTPWLDKEGAVQEFSEAVLKNASLRMGQVQAQNPEAKDKKLGNEDEAIDSASTNSSDDESRIERTAYSSQKSRVTSKEWEMDAEEICTPKKKKVSFGPDKILQGSPKKWNTLLASPGILKKTPETPMDLTKFKGDLKLKQVELMRLKNKISALMEKLAIAKNSLTNMYKMSYITNYLGKVKMVKTKDLQMRIFQMQDEISKEEWNLKQVEMEIARDKKKFDAQVKKDKIDAQEKGSIAVKKAKKRVSMGKKKKNISARNAPLKNVLEIEVKSEDNLAKEGIGSSVQARKLDFKFDFEDERKESSGVNSDPSLLTYDTDEDIHSLISAAFADDDTLVEFVKDKEKHDVAKSDPVEPYAMDWARWVGQGLRDSERERRKKSRKGGRVGKIPTKKSGITSVILNEDKIPKFKEYLAQAVPHPFTSVKDYEASIRLPIGSTWQPETAQMNLITPNVKTKIGVAINPMDEGELNALEMKNNL